MPTAWVEQLRQGSNARIPASRRFRTPSGIAAPLMKCCAIWAMVRFIARLFWPVAMIRFTFWMRPFSSTW